MLQRAARYIRRKAIIRSAIMPVSGFTWYPFYYNILFPSFDTGEFAPAEPLSLIAVYKFQENDRQNGKYHDDQQHDAPAVKDIAA